MNSRFSIRKLVFISILAAMSFVLFMFPKFPIIAAFPWLDLDLSDVPALVASVTVSPLAGLAVVFIKNAIHLAVTSTAMVGELSNFLINGSFVFATGLINKYFMKNDKKICYIIASVVGGAIIQLTVAVVVNYYIMIPMYSAFVNFDELGGASKYIIAGVIPFNLIKDIMAGFVFVVLHKLVFSRKNNLSPK